MAEPDTDTPIIPDGVTLRAFDDAKAARDGIYEGTLAAVKARFPLENRRYRLELSDVRYTGPREFTLAQQKDALLHDKNLHTPLSGHYRLVDKETNRVVDERDDVVMNVPYYTDRGTIINNGSEYTIANQLRLRPGVYTRIRRSGDVETQFNVRPGTGRGFRIRLDPATGVMNVNVGHANMPLYALLRAMGVTDRQMVASWGAETAAANQAKANTGAGRQAVDKLYKAFAGYNATASDLVSKERYLADTLPKFELDPGVTARTLGIDARGITPELLLRAAQKTLNVNRGEERPDDRDNPGFANVFGVEDLYRERIERDAGRLGRTLMMKIARAGSLRPLGRGAFSGWHHELLQGSGLAMPGDNSNPMANEEQMMRVTRMGEGGIGSADVVTDEARNVNPGNLNFIGPIEGPENEKIGVDARLAVHTRKGSDGKLYSLFVNRDGRREYVACDRASDSVIGFPGASPKDREVPAMKDGRVQMVPRDEVDYFMPDMAGMFSANINLNPMPTAVQGGRQFYGAKFWGQYMPTVDGETPLVDSLMPDGKATWSEYYGRRLGTLKAGVDGKVVKVTDKGVTVRAKDGTKRFIETVKDFSFNGLTSLTYTPTVKVGDKVKADDMVAASNYVDPKTGGLAMGHNLRVAWISYLGHSYEDAIVLSESAAKKMATNRLYNFEADPKSGVELGLNRYMSMFPQRFSREQFATLDDNGVVKPGTVLNKGDPIAVGVGPKLLSAEDAQLGKLHKTLRSAFTDRAQVWEHDYPGTVVDSAVFRGRAKVHVRATPQMQIGDKMCYDEETEVLTSHGWKYIKDVTVDDNVATLNPGTGEFDYLKPEMVHRYEHHGRMYAIANSCLDLLVTPNHRMFVKRRSGGAYEFIAAEDVAGKRVSYKKDGIWRGRELPYFTFPAYQIGHRWGLLQRPELRISMDTFLMLLGMYLSEGSCYECVHKNGGRGGSGIAIAQKKPHGVSVADAALRARGLNYTRVRGGFRIPGRHLYNYFSTFGYSWEKRIPEFVFGLSARQQKILFEWMMWGDGHCVNGVPKTYTTASAGLADDVQRLCLHIGIAARVCGRRPAGHYNGMIDGRRIYTRHDSYTVQIINSKLTPMVNHGHVKQQHIQREGFVDYSGFVYCCTMPKWHAIYVRRNGHACWCGNSPRFALKGVIGCYDAATEVLTSSGWKAWPEVTLSDRLAVLPDGAAGHAAFACPEALHAYDCDGYLLHAHTEQLDYRVTGNHRMYCRIENYRGNKAVYRIRTADDVFGKRVVHLCAAEFDYNDVESMPFDVTRYVDYDPAHERKKAKVVFDGDDFAEFLGWYISEGSTSSYSGSGIGVTGADVRSYKIQISQSRAVKPDNCDRIEKLLSRMGVRWLYHGSQYTFSSKPLYRLLHGLGRANEKYLPDFVWGFSKAQLRRLFDGLMAGDGTVTRCVTTRDIPSYVTTSPRLARQVEFLMTLLGYNARILVDKRAGTRYIGHDGTRSANYNFDKYTVSGKACTEIGQSSATFARERYTGKVYCATVPGGLLYVRRSGRPMWCGNSIVPDDEMPRDAATNEPFDILMNPMGIPSRVAPGQLIETALGKLAKATGRQVRIPQDPPPEGWANWAKAQLDAAGVPDRTDIFDPRTGRTIRGIGDGYVYYHAMHHIADKKLSAKGGAGGYTADLQPAKGGPHGAKRNCFVASQAIRVLHGEESIGHIVDKRIPEYVWTRFDDGSWGYSRVTNWFCRKGRLSEVIAIDVDGLPGADNCGRKRVVYTRKTLKVTRQHHVFSPDRGEMLAGDLRPGDWLTSYGYVPTDDQLSLLMGSMLGDGAICNVNDNLHKQRQGIRTSMPYYSEQHSHHQDRYVNWKLHALGALVSSRSMTQNKSRSGFSSRPGQRVAYYDVHRHDIVESLKNMFYRQPDGSLGPKNLSHVDLDLINDVGIVAWFLDDGCVTTHVSDGVDRGGPTGSIATHGFTEADNHRLAAWLGSRIGVDIPVRRTSGTRDGVRHEYFYLGLPAEACRRLARMVARYARPEDIPPSKRWLVSEVSRLASEYVGVDTAYSLGSVPVLVADVRPYSDGKHGPDDEICLYDLTVEGSHKYCASDCLVSNSGLDVNALLAHGATDVLKDIQTVRGSKNEDYWRAVRSGGPLPEPGVPFVYTKAMNLLRAGGINVVEGQKATDIMPMTDRDVDALAGGRYIENGRMLDADMHDIRGGLFDPVATGGSGNDRRWAAIRLPEPIPNPVMEEPVRRVLGLTTKRLQAIISGAESVDGKTGGAALASLLGKIDVDAEIARQKEIVRKTRGSARDNAVKVIGYLSGCKKQGVTPKDWMITKIPVIPPMFRPVAKLGDTALVSDINELYRDVIESADAFSALRGELPDSGLTEERLNVYNAVKAAYGLGDPISPEGQAKRLKGALRQVIGSSPKLGLFQSKVLSKAVDGVGRGVISPEPNYDMDQCGIPEESAWTLYKDYVIRELTRHGYPQVRAMELIDARAPVAKDILVREMARRPVILDRAPTWHKFNLMAFWPHIVEGSTIRMNPVVEKAYTADHDGDDQIGQVRVKFDGFLDLKNTDKEKDTSYCKSIKNMAYFLSLQEKEMGNDA